MAISALVVDDSRVALVALSRMLRAYGFHVDNAESGPETLDYLRANVPPGVIFLDHMMPGMDGFETLAVLKRDPSTTMIPVVMYTSQEGDAYMGQARVLGAAAVLHKPINPLELSNILAQLRLVPDRVAASAARANAPRLAVIDAGAARAGARTAPLAATEAGLAEQRALHGRAPDDQPHAGTGGEPLGTAAPTAAQPGASGGRRGWLLPAVYAALLLVTGAWLWQQSREAAQLRAELAEQRTQLAEQRRVAETASERWRQVQAAVASPRRAQAAPSGWPELLAWALNQRAYYEHDQIALSDERLLMVRELLARLAAIGFQGTVQLETHVGEFCLTRDDQGAYRVPAAATPISRCEIVSYTPEQAVSLARRQSPAFTRFLAEYAATGAPIQVAVVSHGKGRPLLAYPDLASTQTAGEWNQIARINQRVDVVLESTR
jgi:CheY-like chemotaxis protein